MAELEDIKSRFEDTLAFYVEEHERGTEDADFALGEQWDEQDKKNRHNDKRPALTENICLPFIEQVVNTAREMRPSIKVAPVDDQGDPDTAEVYKGLIRNIERQSAASIAYDTAVQNSTMTGYGWIRVNTKYSDPMSFNQEACIEAVPDWQSVMLDPSHERPDGSDAEYGFIYKDIDKDVFEKEYPEAEPESFETGTWRQTSTTDGEKVRIVEYFYKEYDEIEIYECLLPDGAVRVLTKDQIEALQSEGFFVQELQSRTTKLPTVKWCKLYGGGVLEETEWLGKYIPLVPVYGKLVWHDGRLKSYSLITQAKDPQKMLNTIKTTIAEIVGSQPKNQPMIGAVGQFDTDERWQNANTTNYAELQYDPVIITDENGNSMLAPPPTKQQPLQVSPALFQIEMNAKMGVSAALGMYEENRGDESNAISGIAIKSRQLRGDKATFHFIDNLANSIRHVGVILIDIIPKIYNKEQVLRIIGADGREKTVTVNPNAQTDKTQGIYNLGAGQYDVDVDVGSSYATQQQEFLDISKELIKAHPEYASIAGDKIIEAAGGPYADVIAERIKANMPPEMQGDDPTALKLTGVMKQLQASEQEKEQLLIALDTKKKNEEFDNQIQAGELKVKESEAETQRLKVLAEIEEKRLSAEGIQSERLADLADAILDINEMMQAQSAKTDEHAEVINLFLQREEQATAQPERETPAN